MPTVQEMNNSKQTITNIAWNVLQSNLGVTEILIYDVIADKKSYNWWTDEKGTEVTPLAFREELNKITTDEICIRINSGGGNVFAAEAIRTAILDKREEGKKIFCKVDGLCASAAVGIADACETIAISSSSWFMMHDPMALAYGYYNISDLGKLLDMLGKIKQGIINAYAKKTGKDKDEISKIMSEETWYTGDEAVKAGFCDELMFGDLGAEDPVQDVMNTTLNLQMYRHPPASLLNRCAQKAPGGFSDKTPKNTTKKERTAMEEIKTVDDLRAAYPALVAQAVKAAVDEERQRIQDIEDVAIAGFEAIVNEAKFTSPKAAGDVAKAILAEQKKQGVAYLESRDDDIKNGGVGSEGAGAQHEGAKGSGGVSAYDAAIDKLYPANK